MILDDDGREVFDALQNRIHPAESRMNMLAERDAGDLSAPSTCSRSATEDADGSPFSERREALEKLVDGFKDPGSVELTPLADDPERPSPGSRAARA